MYIIYAYIERDGVIFLTCVNMRNKYDLKMQSTRLIATRRD